MNRQYGWAGLKHWVRDWRFIKKGRDSGYPYCCIAWFKIRGLALDLYRLTFNSTGPFKGEVLRFNSDLEYELYKRSSAYKRKARHVCCPFHKLIFFLTQKEHTYHTCGECGWVQFEQPECNNCAQDELYGNKRYKYGLKRLARRFYEGNTRV